MRAREPAGAYGFKPFASRGKLVTRETIDRLRDGPRLEVYADALVTRDGAPERRDGFIERERELTDEEKRFQAQLIAPG